MMLGGVYALDQPAVDRWPSAAAWQLPVGDPAHLGAPGAPDEPGFQVNRGVEWSHGRATHQGADLANGRAGDPVHAAAGGLVTLVYDGDNGNGYGGHVVIAHRLEDGSDVFTVYAHLLAGSIAVRAGDVVAVGDVVGRVGRTGRASTPHLHFEVREPRQLADRWETARVIEPLPFVLGHIGPGLGAPADGIGDGRPAEGPPASGATEGGGDGPATAPDDGPEYTRWAVKQGLLARVEDAARPLTRGTWWTMMAGAVVAGPERRALAPEALRDTLMDQGVLPEEEAGAPADEMLDWSELSRDVKRLAQLGLRVPHGPFDAGRHAEACERRFGQSEPGAHASALKRRPGEPSVTDACVVLADLTGPSHAPAYGRADRHGRTAAAARHRHGRTRKVRHARGHAPRHARHAANPTRAKRGPGKPKPAGA